ncbi:integrase core domain-containing protein [Nocardia sp. NPDC004168]|uniref:integrase core domain-containing protein n=1 Tax=Nocardia sp. NPDC004168 TaxID=3154452 RepID=UPI0033A7A7FD
MSERFVRKVAGLYRSTYRRSPIKDDPTDPEAGLWGPENGHETISYALQRFCAQRAGISIFCRVNGCIEAFNRRLWTECFNRNHWTSLLEAHIVIADYKTEHNQRHRHSAPGYLIPGEYAAACTHTHRWLARAIGRGMNEYTRLQLRVVSHLKITYMSQCAQKDLAGSLRAICPQRSSGTYESCLTFSARCLPESSGDPCYECHVIQSVEPT